MTDGPDDERGADASGGTDTGRPDEASSNESDEPIGTGSDGWPVNLRGITESVVATRGPNDRWNVAALGLHAGVDGDASGADGGDASGVTARTYGRTRTWRNFRERGEGYVQFTRDPVDFVEAALDVRESDDPLLPSVDAWCRVAVRELSASTDDGTPVTTWALQPVECAVERETVPTTNRGYNAVVEATVAASRLDVDAYDERTLRDRLAYCADVTETCGGPREAEAMARLASLVDVDL